MALLTGAITALALGGTPGLPTWRYIPPSSARSYTTTFTRLGPSGTATQVYGAFTKTPASPAVSRAYTADFTRLSAGGTPTQVYGSFGGKSETIVSDFVVSDSIRVYVTEGPFTDVDIDVTEVLRPVVTEPRGVPGQARAGSDSIIPRVSDVIQFLSKTGTTAKTGSDTIRAVVTEASSGRVLIGVSDTVTPVVTDANSALDKSDAKSVSDTITVVLNDQKFLETALANRDFGVTDVIRVNVTESQSSALAGEVDHIHITASPSGRIRIVKS